MYFGFEEPDNPIGIDEQMNRLESVRYGHMLVYAICYEMNRTMTSAGYLYEPMVVTTKPRLQTSPSTCIMNWLTQLLYDDPMTAIAFCRAVIANHLEPIV